jgi:hypothetical protein
METSMDKDDEWRKSAKESTATVDNDRVSPLRWGRPQDDIHLSKPELVFRAENDEDISDDLHLHKSEQNDPLSQHAPFGSKFVSFHITIVTFSSTIRVVT